MGAGAARARGGARAAGGSLDLPRSGQGTDVGPRGRRTAAGIAPARGALRPQGHHRHGGAAHRVRQPHLPRPPAASGRGLCRVAARCGSRAPRQDGDDRVRRPHTGQDAPSGRSRLHAGWLFERIGCGRSHWHGPAGPRHTDSGLHHPPGQLLRRGGLQAQLCVVQLLGDSPRRRGSRHAGWNGALCARCGLAARRPRRRRADSPRRRSAGCGGPVSHPCLGRGRAADA